MKQQGVEKMKVLRWLGASACALGVMVAAPARAACPERTTWPGRAWEDATAATMTSRAAQVAELERYAFTLQGSIQERQGIRTDGVVIIHGGRLVYEKYARGYGPDMRHLTWSDSKSLVNAAVGVGIRLGVVQLDDSVCKHRTFRNKDACKLKVGDLLQWGSGLYWRETYENDTPRVSSVAAMLYGVGSQDMAEFTADQGFEAEPGARFNYSSGDTNLLVAAIAPAMRRALGTDWLWAGILDEIGARSSVVEADAAGTPVGSSYWYATPRDMARFGFLYLNDGCWDGRRVLAEGWVARSTRLNDAFRRGRLGHAPGETVPGLHWWLNIPVDGYAATPMPDVPADTFAAEGHWGQFIWVIPSRDVVIVRTGDDRDDAFDANEFLKRALEVVP